MRLEDISSFLVEEYKNISNVWIMDSLTETLNDFNITEPRTDIPPDDIPEELTSVFLAGARYFLAIKQANYYSAEPQISMTTPYVSRENLTQRFLQMADKYFEVYKKMRSNAKRKYREKAGLIYVKKMYPYLPPDQAREKLGIED